MSWYTSRCVCVCRGGGEGERKRERNRKGRESTGNGINLLKPQSLPIVTHFLQGHISYSFPNSSRNWVSFSFRLPQDLEVSFGSGWLSHTHSLLVFVFGDCGLLGDSTRQCSNLYLPYFLLGSRQDQSPAPTPIFSMCCEPDSNLEISSYTADRHSLAHYSYQCVFIT